MKERIKLLMDSENLTPAKFADTLQIGRAVISHILNGRNNPSLDVIIKILAEMPYINSDWLLTGNGNMYIDDLKTNPDLGEKPTSALPNLFEQNLFSQDTIKPSINKEEIKYRNHNELKETENTTNTSDNKSFNIVNNCDKKIIRIIVYYSDNTFESFDPNIKS